MFDLQLAAKELPLHVTCCSVMEAAPHFAISDFNSQFHTSLVHLMHWKMDTDGFGERQSQDGKNFACMPPLWPFSIRSRLWNYFYSRVLLCFCIMTDDCDINNCKNMLARRLKEITLISQLK